MQTTLKAEIVAAQVNNNETNDCSVKAVAAICGDYNAAHAALQQLGRTNREGASINQIGNAAMACTDKFAHFFAGGPSFKKINVRTFAAICDPNKCYLVYTRGHVTAVTNGVARDYHQLSNAKVESWHVLDINNNDTVDFESKLEERRFAKQQASARCRNKELAAALARTETIFTK